MDNQLQHYFRVSPYLKIIDQCTAFVEQGEGVLKITGRKGTGKSALAGELLRQLKSRGHRALLFSPPPVSAQDLQMRLAESLGIGPGEEFYSTLRRMLVSRSGTVQLVLIIDDAETLENDVLQSLRLLLNLHHNNLPLVKVILCGSNAINAKLQLHENRALNQFVARQIRIREIPRHDFIRFNQQAMESLGLGIIGIDSSGIEDVWRRTRGYPGAIVELWQKMAEYREILPSPISERVIENFAGMLELADQKKDSRHYFGYGSLMVAVVAVAIVLVNLPLGNNAPDTDEEDSDSIFVPLPAPETESDAAPFQPDNTEPENSPVPVPATQAGLPQELPEPQSPDQETGQQSVAAVPTAADASSAAAPPPDSDGDELRRDVDELLNTWSQAWAGQNLSAYFATYHSEFRPADGQSQSQWRSSRETRIQRPASITIDYDSPELIRTEPERITVRFQMRYATPTYGDQTRKQLLLARQDGAWKIIQEESLQTVVTGP